MKVEYYVRNYEQNEQLGLNDMKTENYTEDAAEEKATTDWFHLIWFHSHLSFTYNYSFIYLIYD